MTTCPHETPNQPCSNRDPTEEEQLARLQQAVQDNTIRDNGDAPTDGNGNPIAPGADYASLRLITRRQPKDPDAVLAGLDTRNADLSWTAQEDRPGLDPSGKPWRYPKKRGKGEGSNLDQFKDDITQRTRDGEGCKAIADALIAKGVDTSSRAVARQRMKWGLRQRAPRTMTAQGIANIRKAHLEQAKRLANSDPVPVKRVRIRVMRKAEITRMTKEGLSAAQIADNLKARGVELKRGAATVERLRTVWGLTQDTQRSVNNIRATARNHAYKAQREQFDSIAVELGIEDVETWVKSRMDEEVAQDARREYAYRLMGDARPKPVSLDQLRRNAQNLRQVTDEKRRSNIPEPEMHVDGNVYHPEDPSRQVVAPHTARVSPPIAAATTAHQELVELSDDEGATDDEEMVDQADKPHEAGDAADDQDVSAQLLGGPRRISAALDVNSAASFSEQISSTPEQLNDLNLSDFISINRNTVVPPRPSLAPQVPNATQDPSVHNAGPYKPSNNTHIMTGQGQQSHPSVSDVNFVAVPPAGLPGRPRSSFVPIAPRPSPQLNPRPIAPWPSIPKPMQFHPPHGEADYMAQFGLYPHPTYGKPPQKYLTPNGLVTTDGYEYLASSPQLFGNMSQQTPFPQLEVIRVGALQPELDCIQVPPPPSTKTSKIPAPPLVTAPEEIEKHTSDLRKIGEYQKMTQECMDLLAARVSKKPLLNSLTGLPPSLKDIEHAKEKLREAANAMLALL